MEWINRCYKIYFFFLFLFVFINSAWPHASALPFEKWEKKPNFPKALDSAAGSYAVAGISVFRQRNNHPPLHWIRFTPSAEHVFLGPGMSDPALQYDTFATRWAHKHGEPQGESVNPCFMGRIYFGKVEMHLSSAWVHLAYAGIKRNRFDYRHPCPLGRESGTQNI